MTWRLASLLGGHGGDYSTKDIQVLHYGIWTWRRILNGACISIYNLPENIVWQTHKDDLRPEARGPLKSGAWGGRPTCHPQTPAMNKGFPNTNTAITRRLMRTARTIEAECWQVLWGKRTYGGKESWVKEWARLGCWMLPCYGPFSLGARFETYEPFISVISKIFSGRAKPRITETADTKSVDTEAHL
jgi:hypothetical protein